eukprot:4201570-Pleurochrysis_carterae.AAC.1
MEVCIACLPLPNPAHSALALSRAVAPVGGGAKAWEWAALCRIWGTCRAVFLANVTPSWLIIIDE